MTSLFEQSQHKRATHNKEINPFTQLRQRLTVHLGKPLFLLTNQQLLLLRPQFSRKRFLRNSSERGVVRLLQSRKFRLQTDWKVAGQGRQTPANRLLHNLVERALHCLPQRRRKETSPFNIQSPHF